MNFLIFKEKFFNLSIFTRDQVYAWYPKFDRNNLTNWVKKGLLIRLKNGYYTFPEYMSAPAFHFYFANKIYKPSYISLHSALSYFGLIPESVVQLTSVTTLKTQSFKNEIGEYVYKKIDYKSFFGYQQIRIEKEKYYLISTPEKGIIDLFYLYPEYSSEKEILNLRFDEDILTDSVNSDRLLEYAQRMETNALISRIKKFIKLYGI